MTNKRLPKMHTVEEVASALATTRETVARWIREGRMPAVKLAGEWRIRRSDLERVMAEGLQ